MPLWEPGFPSIFLMVLQACLTAVPAQLFASVYQQPTVKLEGEAWFEVSRDEDHPFEINAGNSTS